MNKSSSYSSSYEKNSNPKKDIEARLYQVYYGHLKMHHAAKDVLARNTISSNVTAEQSEAPAVNSPSDIPNPDVIRKAGSHSVDGASQDTAHIDAILAEIEEVHRDAPKVVYHD
jgi:hypothetical protein